MRGPPRISSKTARPADGIDQHLYVGGDTHGGRFLVDMREATIVAGVMDTFEVGRVPSTSVPIRVATKSVYSGSLEAHRFMETVAVNRGFRIHVFDDMEVAFHWLRAEAQAGRRQ